MKTSNTDLCHQQSDALMSALSHYLNCGMLCIIVNTDEFISFMLVHCFLSFRYEQNSL